VVKIALHSLKAVPRKLNWVRQMQKLIQRRPPEGGRYKFKNDCNCWRSRDAGLPLQIRKLRQRLAV
jgi:hypothetical protein